MPIEQRTDTHPPLAVIGGGNMASAIIFGAADAGVLDPARCVIADPDPNVRTKFQIAVPTASEALDRLAEFEIDQKSLPGQILLAVKPQVFPLIADELLGRFDGDSSRVVLSVIAGVRSATIRRRLGQGARVVRIMPNTPARIRRGMCAITIGDGAQSGDEQFGLALMQAVGEVIGIDESMMDAFTGFAGSGPAYVFYLAEAMAKAGEAVGFDPAEAQRIANAVLIGSAGLLESDDRSPAELRRAVTSPNGTTQAGTETLDRQRMMDAIIAAVTAARDRGAELAAAAD